MSELLIFVNFFTTADSTVVALYFFILHCLYVLACISMELNGIDMFYILWAITPFWIGKTQIN